MDQVGRPYYKVRERQFKRLCQKHTVGWNSSLRGRRLEHKKKGAHEKSPSRGTVLSIAHYFQAPATQASEIPTSDMALKQGQKTRWNGDKQHKDESNSYVDHTYPAPSPPPKRASVKFRLGTYVTRPTPPQEFLSWMVLNMFQRTSRAKISKNQCFCRDPYSPLSIFKPTQ